MAMLLNNGHCSSFLITTAPPYSSGPCPLCPLPPLCPFPPLPPLPPLPPPLPPEFWVARKALSSVARHVEEMWYKNMIWVINVVHTDNASLHKLEKRQCTHPNASTCTCVSLKPSNQSKIQNQSDITRLRKVLCCKYMYFYVYIYIYIYSHIYIHIYILLI